jgi:hypothetical protein
MLFHGFLYEDGPSELMRPCPPFVEGAEEAVNNWRQPPENLFRILLLLLFIRGILRPNVLRDLNISNNT